MWLQNFMKNLYLGTELTDEQLKDIPYPREELHFYVLHKNIQVSFKNKYVNICISMNLYFYQLQLTVKSRVVDCLG